MTSRYHKKVARKLGCMLGLFLLSICFLYVVDFDTLAQERLPFQLIGWSTKKDEKGLQDTSILTRDLDQNKRLYAIYDLTGVKNIYHGNGASDYVKDAQWQNKVFEEVRDGKREYYIAQDNVKNYESNGDYKPSLAVENPFIKEKATFVGWALDAKATYKNKNQIILAGTNTYSTGELVDWLSIVKDCIRNQVWDAKQQQIDLYAIWDSFPEAQVGDVVIAQSQIDQLAEEDFKERIRYVHDEEDGEQVDFYLDYEELKMLKEELKTIGNHSLASASLPLYFRDGYGNVTKIIVDVWVNNTSPDEEYLENSSMGHSKDGYIRTLNPKSFEREYQKGGLHTDSVWRKDEDYRKELLDAFSNIGTYGTWGWQSYSPHAVASYTFSREQILDFQKQILDFQK